MRQVLRYRFSVKRLKLVLLLFATGVVVVAVAALMLVGDLPDPDALITRSSPDTTKILDRNGRLLYEVLDPRAGRRTRVRLETLPPYLPQAVIAVEDVHFLDNPGIDLVGIARAMYLNLRAGTIVAGGSTITQQLARDLLMSKEERESRSYLRKLREAVMAIRLTQAYSKDQILEMYLNEVYFGNLAYGVEAAARTYFGKPAHDLDLAESALLAGMIQSPFLYDPFVDYDAAIDRQHVVLGLLERRGSIKKTDYDWASSEQLHLASPRTAIHAPHFVAYVRDLLEQRYGPETVNRGGLDVITSLDLDLQERAEQIITQQIQDLKRRTTDEGEPDYNVHDAALVALDLSSGEIVAMVGSADYFDEQINGAVNVALANRQPGSAIKPITYATAFSMDYTPATVLSDVPTSFVTKEGQPYEPQNYDRMSRGPMSLREALATSNNVIAVKVLDHVGLDAMVATARALGISTFEDSERFGLALTLGGGEVKLLELTAAYGAFAGNGERLDPVAIVQVNGQEGFYGRLAGCADGSHCTNGIGISPQIAYLITSILSDDYARIGAFGEESALHLTRPAAAKTGTTTDFKDNWTIGYTPDLVVGVWVGNADNTPMYKISGITGAGPIWHDFMEEALKSKPARSFERPNGLVDAEICQASGLVPTEYCPRQRTETFVAGTEPTLPDDAYRPVALEKETGLLWDSRCQGSRVERVYRYLPPEARDWGEKQGLPNPPTVNCLGEVVAGPLDEPEALGTRSPLVVSSPAPFSVFSPTPQLPPEMQRIEVAARLNSPIVLEHLELTVDGHPIGSFVKPPYRALWTLVPGDHVVLAVGVAPDGKQIVSPTLQFSVQPSN